MNLLFKALGFVLIISSTTLFGFLKSNSLRARYKKLCSIKNAVSDLKQRIRLSHGEIDKLIALSFEKIPDYYSDLGKSDIEIVKEFFSNIGLSDTKAECERCELCISLIDTQILEAQSDCQNLSKLYKSIGFLSGIFICIFFL